MPDIQRLRDGDDSSSQREDIDREAPASRIAAKFGGINALARALNKSPSTVYRWIQSGLIPARYQAEVLNVAKALKIKMGPGDFIREQPPLEAA